MYCCKKQDSDDISKTSGITNEIIISDSNLIKISGGSGRTRIFDLRCIRATF